jgi:hypothetical protein
LKARRGRQKAVKAMATWPAWPPIMSFSFGVMKNRLKLLRAERTWTQAQLADALDVSRQTVFRLHDAPPLMHRGGRSRKEMRERFRCLLRWRKAELIGGHSIDGELRRSDEPDRPWDGCIEDFLAFRTRDQRHPHVHQ